MQEEADNEFAAGAWTEAVGTVKEIDESSVSLLCTRKITLRLGKENLAKWKHLLVKGSLIGILKLDDGSFRVRLVESESPTKVPRHKMRRRGNGGETG